MVEVNRNASHTETRAPPALRATRFSLHHRQLPVHSVCTNCAPAGDVGSNENAARDCN
jgi:hypothetical protein